ncbi:potassium transporter Trk [Microbacterium immunditiarum]|uniref:Potassium transporter Trk n=1 Tax=Microbacterium immunditiarum TaxID=337480 RepID=A0A7Y9KGM3_9MICO|nr:potassium transporter Trk [Microbacterium immunditiarum]NYE18637.1 hypothetical protein [Microbacterium immunditiarum]
MADQAPSPLPDDSDDRESPLTPPTAPEAPRQHAELIEDEVERATVRRTPKYPVFLVVGAALGLIVAMILTFTFSGTSEESPTTGLVYSQGQVFGFLLLICIPVGLALGGITALVLDRVFARRAHAVTVDHERIHTLD